MELDYQAKMSRNHKEFFPRVAGDEFLHIYETVRSRTMLPMERLFDLYLSCRYVDAAAIRGAIVEVGVWKGGALATALLTSPENGRSVVGFDTFEGHLLPESDEFDIRGENMRERYLLETQHGESWAAADADECFDFLSSVTAEPQRIQLIPGDIRETLPVWNAEEIAILRVDCDWYAETKLSLEVLWPCLALGGVLILDDYGHHSGQKRATDEFFSSRPTKFTFVDYSCVTTIKTQP